MWMMIKDDQFRDNPPDPSYRPGGSSHDKLIPLYTADRPEVHGIVAGLRDVLDRYDDRVMIGELYLPIDRLVTYYGPTLNEAHLPFNFQLLLNDWNAGVIARIITEYEAALPPGGWPNWVLGNHDRPRIASRVGAAQAKVAAVLLLTLRGTPTIYNGEELGMEDVPIPPDEVRDPAELREPGRGLGRDPERTPILWDATLPGHGFTTGRPWLRFGETVDASAQATDPASMLSLYRRLIALRRAHPALVEGMVGAVRADGDILSFERHMPGQSLAVFLNLGATERSIRPGDGRILLSTHERAGVVSGEIPLLPAEAIIIALA